MTLNVNLLLCRQVIRVVTKRLGLAFLCDLNWLRMAQRIEYNLAGAVLIYPLRCGISPPDFILGGICVQH